MGVLHYKGVSVKKGVLQILWKNFEKLFPKMRFTRRAGKNDALIF